MTLHGGLPSHYGNQLATAIEALHEHEAKPDNAVEVALAQKQAGVPRAQVHATPTPLAVGVSTGTPQKLHMTVPPTTVGPAKPLGTAKPTGAPPARPAAEDKPGEFPATAAKLHEAIRHGVDLLYQLVDQVGAASAARTPDEPSDDS